MKITWNVTSISGWCSSWVEASREALISMPYIWLGVSHTTWLYIWGYKINTMPRVVCGNFHISPSISTPNWRPKSMSGVWGALQEWRAASIRIRKSQSCSTPHRFHTASTHDYLKTSDHRSRFKPASFGSLNHQRFHTIQVSEFPGITRLL